MSSFAPLHTPVFAGLWSASVISNIGTAVQAVAAAWMMATLVASPTLIALVHSASTLPIFFLALPIGAMVDRYERRTIMLVAQLIMMTAAFAMAILGFLNALSPLTLLLLTFFLGVGAALNAPSWQASIGDLVPRDQLQSAVTLHSFSVNGARSIGPALGGAIVAALGAPAAFLLNAVSTLPLLGMILRLKVRSREDTRGERIISLMRTGLAYATRAPSILRMYVRAGVFGFCAGALWGLLPVIARDQFNSGAALYGMFFAAFGVGALIVIFPSGGIRRVFNPNKIWTVASIAFAAASIVAGLSRSTSLTLVFLVVAGASSLLCVSTLVAQVQLNSERWIVGRTIALHQGVMLGSLAIGSAFWGGAAQIFDLNVSLCAAGAILIVLTAIIRAFPFSHGGPEFRSA